MNTKQVLQAAYDLIGDKRRWTQGAFAKDRSGRSVDTRNDKAVCWCAGGAIDKYGGSKTHAFSALSRICLNRHEHGIAYVNDQLGYAAIRRMFRKAIKEAA